MTDMLLIIGLGLLLILALEGLYRVVTGAKDKPEVPRKVSLLVVGLGTGLLILFFNSVFELSRVWRLFSGGAAAALSFYAVQIWFGLRKH